MKRVIKEILFGKIPVKEYLTITIPGGIYERVYFEINNKRMDVSERQYLLCLEPVVFGIWIDKNSILMNDLSPETNSRLLFTGFDNKKNEAPTVLAEVELDYMERIVESEGSLFLLKLSKTKLYHISLIRTWLLYFKFYKKRGFSFNKFKSFVAGYSYPRKVRLITFKEEGYFNIFPMDLLGSPPGTNLFVFGLRHTNITLPKIISSEKIVVSEIAFTYKDIIYELGKHHGSAPPSAESLPFRFIPSQSYGFPVPEWVCGYNEINIYKTIDLGSHMLLWGKSVNKSDFVHCSSHLYHVHFLQYLSQLRANMDYPEV